MRTPRLLTLTAALGFGLAACDSTPLETELDNSADQLGALLAAASGDPDSRGGGGGSAGTRCGSIFDRLDAQIDGFGGLYRAGQCAVVIVLTDLTHADLAIRIAHAVIEPLVARTCPDGISVGVAQGHFTYSELQRFFAAALPLTRLDGVYWVQIDYSLNALVIAVATHEVAHRVLAALAEMGVPARAVVFRVRGGGGRPGG
jgi:hypothetical protein